MPAIDRKEFFRDYTQFQPREGKSVRAYKDRGKRDELFLKIFEELRALGNQIRRSRGWLA
jgi:hypothetical protein